MTKKEGGWGVSLERDGVHLTDSGVQEGAGHIEPGLRVAVHHDTVLSLRPTGLVVVWLL